MSDAEEYLEEWAKINKLEIKLQNKFDYFYPREKEVEELVNLAVHLARKEEREKEGLDLNKIADNFHETQKKLTARVRLEIAKEIFKALSFPNAIEGMNVKNDYWRLPREELIKLEKRFLSLKPQTDKDVKE